MKKKLITSLLLATLVLGACQSGSKDASKEEKKTAEGKQINIGQLAADVRSKYEDTDEIEVADKLTIARDERIKLDVGFNPKDVGMERYTEVVEMYLDPQLTQGIGTHFDNDEGPTYIEILPPRSAMAQISNDQVDRKDHGNETGESFLFKQEDNEDWGNISQMYMAVKVDLETGEKLDKPIVTPVTIQHEIAGDLRLKMSLNELGIPEFTWNDLPGADYYYVIDMDYEPEKGISTVASVKDKVEGTSWETEKTVIFNTFKVSEADRQTKENIEKYGEGTEAIPKDSPMERNFAVIAVSEDGTSAISNTLNLKDLAKRIPFSEEVAISNKEEGGNTVAEMGMLPSYRWVTMSDGSLVQKLINYDTSKAKETKELWSTAEKEDLSDLEAHEIEMVTVPYTVEGTPFDGKARVENYYVDTWKDDLEKIKERQDELRNKAGSTQVEIIPEEAEEPTERKEDDSKDKKDKKEETEETETKDKKRQSDKTDESDESSDSSEKSDKTESSSRKETEESSVEETKESSKKDDNKGSKRRKKREAEEASASKESSEETKESTKETKEESSESEEARDSKEESSESTSSTKGDKKKDKKKERKNKTDETVSEVEDQITANNPLSEYLAINMLDGKETIDISDFPEALIQDNLFDAWMEAIYQNPLILSVKGAQIADYGKSLSVTYEIEREEMKEKQAELRTEVKKVVSDIIEDGMSDLEKEYAINAYLIDIAEYDNSALENAEKNDFVNVDPEFNDSFTPYGVLINKVGVCASYAGAFKLLADEAELEAIVVTGYLEGDLPHAWNKVKIGDNWHILDATNNDNDLLTNALLNIPELASRKVLVEDDRYVVNTHLDDYKASDEDKDSEFYHVEDKFYSKDKIADELISTIEKDGSAALRTNYNLTDEDFATISEKVYKETKDEELQGLYWMGVIYLIGSK